MYNVGAYSYYKQINTSWGKDVCDFTFYTERRYLYNIMSYNIHMT